LFLSFAFANPITVKGLYFLDTNLNVNTEGGGFYYDIDYNINPGAGIALEYSLLSIDLFDQLNIENLLGGSIALKRNIPKAKARVKYHGGDDHLNGKVSDKDWQTNSIYSKTRAFITWPFSFYIGGKISYNIVSFDTDATKTGNGIGCGISLGKIINNWDLEISYDRVFNRIDIEDGVDVLNGNYDMADISISCGYRF
jgi:hypothetical protein